MGGPCCVTQAGISAAVHVQRKHVPRTLKRLEKSQEVSVQNRHVPGAKQRKKSVFAYDYRQNTSQTDC